MIEELRRFIAVAHAGNLTKTAEKLFLTQSALSQSIQRLEKALDTKLFVQKGRHLEITNDGTAVLSIGKKIIELWENAKKPNLRKTLKPRISLGMFDNAALRLGPFFQKYNNSGSFHLELTLDGSSKLITQLKLGILDTAICVINKNSTLPNDITLVHTFSEKLLPVSSQKWKQKESLVPFILYNKGSFTRDQIDAVFKQNNITPQIFAESTSPTFMKELALLGSGVALLPENYVKSEIAQGTLFKQNFPIKWTREYGIFIQEQSGVPVDHPIITEMIQALKDSYNLK